MYISRYHIRLAGPLQVCELRSTCSRLGAPPDARDPGGQLVGASLCARTRHGLERMGTNEGQKHPRPSVAFVPIRVLFQLPGRGPPARAGACRGAKALGYARQSPPAWNANSNGDPLDHRLSAIGYRLSTIGYRLSATISPQLWKVKPACAGYGGLCTQRP